MRGTAARHAGRASRRLLAAALATVLAAALLGPPAMADGAPDRGPRAPALVYLHGAPPAAAADITGRAPLEDYGEFVLDDLTRTEAAALEAAGMDVEYIDCRRIRAGDRIVDTRETAPTPSPTGGGWALVQFIGPVRTAWLDRLRDLGAEVHQYLPGYAFVVRLEEASWDRLAQYDRIRWLGPCPEELRRHPDPPDTAPSTAEPPAAPQGPVPLNNTVRGVIRSDLVQSRGITGAGDLSDGLPPRQVVAITDTGVYWNHECYSRPGKQTAFIDIAGDSGGSGGDGTGHGTHLAGTVLGDAPSHDLWNKYDGHACGADYVAVKVFNNFGSWVGGSDYYGIWLAAYDAGARINNNGWGAAYGGAYSPLDQHADAICWDHRDYLLCCRAGVSGASGPSTINAPAAAKNVISCGATYTADPDARPVWSSRGPTGDGRIRPDVCAPGVDIASARYGTVDQYMVYSGCASPTAAVCGAAALVRDYYMLGYYPSGVKSDGDALTPGAVLIKATLINGAVELTGGGADDNGEGVYPNNSQGWGRIHLDNALYFAGDDRRLKVWDGPADLDTGRAWTGTYVLGGADRGLKVTLAYTDYPGPSLNNDLNLEVVAPDGTTFKGNNFAGLDPGYSFSGGTFDATNNVEGVHLIPGHSFPYNLPLGTYTIRVYGTNVPQPHSDFAVVVGEFACKAPPPREDVALMGDYGTQLRDLLTGAGYTVRSYGGSDYAAVTAHLVNHKVVLLHRVTSGTGLDSLRAEAARQKKGLVFLSSYTVGSHAMGVLSARYGDPGLVAHNWADGPVRLKVEATHPVLDGYSVGQVVTTIDGGSNDYQSYDGWSGRDIGSNQMGFDHPWFIGVKERKATGGAKWVVMGSFGACAYTGTSAWTADGRQILCNAVDWAMAP